MLLFFFFFYNTSIFLVSNFNFIKLRVLLLFSSINISLVVFILSFLYLFISNSYLPKQHITLTYDFCNLPWIITSYSSIFLILFAILFPIIFFFILQDHSKLQFKFFMYFFFIQVLSYLIIITDHIICFYFLYELILIFIFNAMYLSSNTRGSIEATLFYGGWALIGSIFLGIGILYFYSATQIQTFSGIVFHHLTTTELYYIYLCLFFGFGTKLSTWPFWYWLPRAHVEVSTGMSIFLSCILIKLALFALLKFHIYFLTEISYFICILVALLGVFDVILRVVNIKDLKALIAFSSVLHTNLLVVLIHIDIYKVCLSSILYIWGHSLATTGLFIAVYLIELQYNSRNILQVTGLWTSNPLLCYLILWNLFFFIELPVSIFFWGEFWLWLVFFENFFFVTCFILIFTNIWFLTFFFKFWWNTLCGTPTLNINSYNYIFFKELYFYSFLLIILQIILGFQPNLLTSYVFF